MTPRQPDYYRLILFGRWETELPKVALSLLQIMALLCSFCDDALCPIVSETVDIARFCRTIEDGAVTELFAAFTAGQIYQWKQLRCPLAILLSVDVETASQEEEASTDSRVFRVCARKIYSHLVKTSLESLVLECEMDDLQSGRKEWSYMYDISVNFDDPLATCILRRPDYGTWTLDSTVQLARVLLHDCDKHSHISPTSIQLPTRLIYVGTQDSDVCLRVSTGLRAQYLALSYCWGTAQTMVTNTSNLQAHLNSLVVSQLPTTIRDAIGVTRGLGFYYIWIDSLCIVQDDKHDVAVEISNMASIYSNSELTISAEDAVDCHDGLITPCDRDSQLQVLVRLPYLSALEVRGHLNIMSDSPRYCTGHIHSRSWTMQEHYLPNRILYLGNALRWQCPAGVFNSMPLLGCKQSTLIRQTSLVQFNTPYDMQSSDSSYVPVFWYEKILVEAVARDLARQSDSLPSLAGMASAFAASAHPDEYLGGIWKRSFVMGMLWYVDDPGVRIDSWSQRRQRAPTWSPLSLKRPTTLKWMPYSMYKGYELVAELINCSIILQNPETLYGRISSGELIISAPFYRVIGSQLRSGGDHDDNCVYFPDDGRLVALERTMIRRESRAYFWVAILVHEISRTSGPFSNSHGLYGWKDSKVGVVLSERGDGTFERIGHFRKTDLEVDVKECSLCLPPKREFRMV